MGLIIGGVSASDLILDGRSVSLYVGGNPPTKVWPTRDTVQITLGSGYEARDQFRAALTARGLNYETITEIPFDIELVGTGTTMGMFSNCLSLTSVPAMDTSQVTNMLVMFAGCEALTTVPDMDTSSVTSMSSMFEGCSALTYVPDIYTAQVTDTSYMFFFCTSLTDGNVRLIGRNPNVSTENMIGGSGLTREPWYNADGTPLTPREVTIKTGDYMTMGFDKSTATGDTDLIGGWPTRYGENGVSFTAPVTCNLRTNNMDSFGRINAGTTIPSGTAVVPTATGQYVAHVFTEVL